MRYVPSLPPPNLTGIGTREVRGAIRTRAVRPVRIRSHPEEAIDMGPPREPRPEAAVPPPAPAVEHRTLHPGDRRVACRRLNHRPVLLDLRAGLDRRHRKLRSTDLTDHVDEEA